MLITMVIIAGVSLTTSKEKDDPKAIHLKLDTFKTGTVFNFSAYGIILILVVLYSIFW